MPIDPDVQEVIDYLDTLPAVDAAKSALDELRLHNDEIASRYDLPEISMYQERSLDIPGPNGSVPVRLYWPRKLERDERLPILIFIHGGAVGILQYGYP